MNNKRMLSTIGARFTPGSHFVPAVLACVVFVVMACGNMPTTQQGQTGGAGQAGNDITAVAQTVSAQLTLNALMTAAAQNNPAGVATAAVQTMAAQLTQSAQSQPTSPPPTTAPSTSPPPPTVSPSPTVPSIPCDWAQFIADVTITDGSTMAAGTAFTKTWRLKNIGTCTWTTSYAVVFYSGEAMGGPSSQALTSTVAPGGTIDISVNLVAPTTPDTHIGNWRLRNASGTIFGIGSSYTGGFNVNIKVPAVEFAVTHIDTIVAPPVWVGPIAVPAIFTVLADITTNGAGTVKYHWTSSIGDLSMALELNFDAAGKKAALTIPLTVACVPGFSGWIAIYVDEPNHQEFSKAPFSIAACTP